MQACLSIFTIWGLLLISRAKGNPRRELTGYVVMLAGQIFWLASTWIASLWGMFLVSVLYTIVVIDAIVVRARRLSTWPETQPRRWS